MFHGANDWLSEVCFSVLECEASQRTNLAPPPHTKETVGDMHRCGWELGLEVTVW